MDRSKHGFAGMDREKVREIARMGGKAVHRMGKGYKFDGETGKVAGRKGGIATAEKRKR